MAANEVRPQKGFQEKFLSSPADIVIGGSGAGVGKTFALVMEPLRYMSVPGFGAIIFRRTYPQITNEGGLWDTTKSLYPCCGLKQNETFLEWKNSLGNKIKFSHLQHEKNVYDFQGSQIPFIGFDELTHFSKSQFFYLLSRNRSVCGVKPYVRATCNPDPDSWVKDFIAWWLDAETGYPIKERAGVIRYFTRDGNSIVWGDSAQEVIDRCPHIFSNPDFKDIALTDLIKSATFIPGSIYENQELLKINPSYLGDLLAQDEQTKSQLLDNNWNIKQDNLSIYQYGSITDIFTNEHVKGGQKYITVDAARFGSDLAVIAGWDNKRWVDVDVYELSAINQIADAVKRMEKKHGIPRSKTVCDADGIGGGVVDLLPGMNSFVNNGTPVNIKGQKEQYDNLKTQCYYRSAEAVNKAEYYVSPEVAEREVKGVPIRTLLSQELRAIKRDKPNADGKKKIIKKEQMKNILGRSPDFADTFMMREWFDLSPSYKARYHFG